MDVKIIWKNVEIRFGTSYYVSRNKNLEAMIKKKKKKHCKVVLLTKTKLNSREGLISKALIDLNISHDESVLVNNCIRRV